MYIALGMKEEEQSKPKAVKFKVDEESDSDGLFSDDDMSYDSSDSDDSELEVAGGYYTKEMFLKKSVLVSLLINVICCVLLTCCPLLCPLHCYALMTLVMSSLLLLYALMFLMVSSLPLLYVMSLVVSACIFIIILSNCYYGNVLLL